MYSVGEIVGKYKEEHTWAIRMKNRFVICMRDEYFRHYNSGGEMLRYDEESQLLDEDVPRIAHNAGALVFMLFCSVVIITLSIVFLLWLV